MRSLPQKEEGREGTKAGTQQSLYSDAVSYPCLDITRCGILWEKHCSRVSAWLRHEHYQIHPSSFQGKSTAVLQGKLRPMWHPNAKAVGVAATTSSSQRHHQDSHHPSQKSLLRLCLPCRAVTEERSDRKRHRQALPFL